MVLTNSFLAVNPEICRGCELCLLTCSLYHTSQCNPTLARLRVSRDINRYAYTIQVCFHCEDAECVAACPVDALHRGSEGQVILVSDECISCGVCQPACPYGSIYYDPKQGSYFKCDLCQGRESGPGCVEACPNGAILMGTSLPGGR